MCLVFLKNCRLCFVKVRLGSFVRFVWLESCWLSYAMGLCIVWSDCLNDFARVADLCWFGVVIVMLSCQGTVGIVGFSLFYLDLQEG